MIKRYITISLFILLFIFVFMLLQTSPVAAENNQLQHSRIQYGLDLQYFKWKEFDDNNAKLVDETGYLFGMTCDFDAGRDILGWRGGAEVLGGPVHYKGVTWSHEKVKTDGLNLGTQLYLDLVPNYRLKSGLWLKSFIGIGFRGWLRDLNDTQTQGGIPVNGAEEWWGSVYGRVGVGASYPVFKTIEIFTEAGSKIPVYTVNYANIAVSGTAYVAIKPEMKFSPFVDFGVRWKQLRVKLYYDTLWFDKSGTVNSGSYEVYQPESESDIIGLNVAWMMAF